MVLPPSAIETALATLFCAKDQPEIPEPEFTPFDLSHLQDMTGETGRPGFTKFNRVAAYPPPVPFNYPQI